jgi:hypothetical protein
MLLFEEYFVLGMKRNVTNSLCKCHTELCGQVLNTPALYLGGPRLKSWPGDWLPDFSFSWFSSVPPGKYQDSTLN